MSLAKLFGFLFSILSISVFAQESKVDSLIHLNEVTVKANRLESFSAGTKTQWIDSAALGQYRNGTLTDVLENESPVFIKSYGLGSLATTSFRGGSASQTAILWNGFNLNSPMNGQLDLSLVPDFLIDKIGIQYGGASALWGSGAIGGTIHLDNDAQFDKGISVTAGSSAGSFNSFAENMQVEISKANWVTSVKVFDVTAKNDFDYYNTDIPGAPKVTQTNDTLKQYGLLFENYLRINNRQKINLRYWYENSNRDIPPTMLQNNSNANQKDESYRVTAEWQKTEDKVIYAVRAAYFDEHLLYTDSASDVNSFNRSQTVITEAEAKIILPKNQLLNAGVNNTYVQALSDGYPYEPHQNSTAFFASYRFSSSDTKFLTTLSARQEMIEGVGVPFTYSLGSEYKFTDWLTLKGNASKVYRVPTLNDLYWNPGGNPNLLPESGYTEEAGVVMKWTPQSRDTRFCIPTFSFEPTVFNKNIDNWILWLPGQSYWSPQNVMMVWSRGLETRSEVAIQMHTVTIKLGVMTNYVLSTNQETKTENDASVGKQLIYVPIYSGHGKVSLEYKRFTLSYLQNYEGYRFTSTDNTEYLKPYTLANIYAAYKMTFNKCTVNLFAQANNIFNEQYQALLSYAMPLINYQAGVTIQFNKPNN